MRKTSQLILFLTVTVALSSMAHAQERAPVADGAWLMVPALPSGGSGQDTVDALYREARRSLNNRAYMDAARQFADIHRRFPRAELASSAMYWEAFARYRSNSTDELGVALRVLDQFRARFPDAREGREADQLAVRIRGELAQRGDATAAEDVARAAAPPAPPAAGATPRPPRAATAPAPAPTRAQTQEEDIRVAALNALLQMDAEAAIPILKQVLERRDEGSVELRRKAVFLVSQKKTNETADILLNVARQDPSNDVRAQAVFWLSQVPDERAVGALDSILNGSNDREVQDKAIFALSQHRSAAAGAALRTYVQRTNAPADLREKAIFWLGQHRSAENQQFLRELYPKLETTDLKERVLFAVSQRKEPGNSAWLMGIAQNRNESIELRKKALFWAGQMGQVDIAELDRLYNAMDDMEMREQIIFVASQRREKEAVDLLMKIAENDPDPKLRSKAVFWLGQSKDPRVPEFLLRIINRP